MEDNGRIYLNINGKKIFADPPVGAYTIANFSTIIGTPEGLQFNFQAPLLNGVMYYGFIPQTDSKFPQPVFVGRSARIEGGVATAQVSAMGDNLDMIGWMSSHQGILGYRIVDQKANMIFDGKINFIAEEYIRTYNRYSEGAYGQKFLLPTKPFSVVTSIIEGPLLANLTDNSVVIQFKTNIKTKVFVKVGGKKFTEKGSSTHEIKITGLSPDKEHNYARTRLNSKTKLNRTISGKKLSLNREIWQINNGAAGAPYYAQEKTPWSKSVEGFTTQNALVFFHVDGDKIQVEVFNPVTLEKFDTFDLN